VTLSSRAHKWTASLVLIGAIIGATSYAGPASSATPSRVEAARASASWHASWATAQQTTGPQLENQTVRTIVHLTQGGPRLRVSLANQASNAPITVSGVAVGRREGAAGLDAASVRTVLFGGLSSVTIEPGARVTSDPVAVDVQAQQDVFVDTYVAGPAVPSAHAAAFDTSYLTPAGSGNHAGEPSGAAFTQTTESTLLVSSVDVKSRRVVGTVAVVGGSVVDGLGSRSTGELGTGAAAPPNSRWSDVLARRLLKQRSADRQVSVVNAGISGNTASPVCAASPAPSSNVTDRFGRDVLSRAGLTHVFVYAGTNDIANKDCTVKQILTAFKGLARKAHKADLEIFFATLTPRDSYSAAQNNRRGAVNRWLRRGGHCSGYCDGVVDFDAAIRDPARPTRIDPAYDSGDGVHPNADGYARMGRVVPLKLFGGPDGS
jgi:lysophospholipase L1-like esterase